MTEEEKARQDAQERATRELKNQYQNAELKKYAEEQRRIQAENERIKGGTGSGDRPKFK